jgi:heme/copper-type cytochrome/quinol oxidase subunit 1
LIQVKEIHAAPLTNYRQDRELPMATAAWGAGATTLEWTLPSPPPFHQYDRLPLIK